MTKRRDCEVEAQRQRDGCVESDKKRIMRWKNNQVRAIVRIRVTFAMRIPHVVLGERQDDFIRNLAKS